MGVAATVGVISSAALTAYTGEPISSSIAGTVLGALMDDFGARIISKREEQRIKTAITYAMDAIKRRYIAGHDYRNDGFFQADPDSRSFFEEIAEGVLLAAQREYEEKKLPYLGSLISNIAYSSNIDRASANWAVRTASELGWTQYMLIAAVGRDEVSLPDVSIGTTAGDWPSWSIHHELNDLHWVRALVGAPAMRTPLQSLPYMNNNAAEMRLNSGGHLLFHLLELTEIPRYELEEMLQRMLLEPQVETS